MRLPRSALAALVFAVFAALTASLASCDRAPAPTPALTTPATAHGGLGGGAVARVGADLIPASLVGAVAGAEHVDPRIATDRLIDDSLAAQAVRARGDDRIPPISWEITSILGRATAAAVRAASLAAGPPTDEEIAQLSRNHWLEVEVPESVRASHAIVLHPTDHAQYPAAHALAVQLAAAVAGAKDEADFEARAKAVPPGPFEIRVENIPTPFVADGRFVASDNSFLDVAFARGALALKKPGDISGLVESSFGWHVIRLIERIPPKIMPIAQRRVQFADETYTRRSRAALDALLEARRAKAPIDVLPDAETRMTQLFAAMNPVEPAPPPPSSPAPAPVPAPTEPAPSP